MNTTTSSNRIATRRASRLDAFIRRVAAQRACLNHAAALLAGMDGPVLEFGLGNGRTYDHLRALFPGRDIFVFDREIAAHPDSVPDAGHMRLGDFGETLPGFAREGRPRAVLAHADIGSPDRARDAALAAWLGPALAPLLAPGAIVAADRAMDVADWEEMTLPAGVPAGDYHLYRVVRTP
ncbi:MAG: class I SAM-dependent methyltransferase [Alphaproteobacteria bacterium]